MCCSVLVALAFTVPSTLCLLRISLITLPNKSPMAFFWGFCGRLKQVTDTHSTYTAINWGLAVCSSPSSVTFFLPVFAPLAQEPVLPVSSHVVHGSVLMSDHIYKLFSETSPDHLSVPHWMCSLCGWFGIKRDYPPTTKKMGNSRPIEFKWSLWPEGLADAVAFSLFSICSQQKETAWRDRNAKQNQFL